LGSWRPEAADLRASLLRNVHERSAKIGGFIF
jgi:hypothetical protein